MSEKPSTHGISSGNTSVMMLMESVLALEVGAAASRILSSAIMYCGSDGSMDWYSSSAGVWSTEVSGRDTGCLAMSSSRWERERKDFVADHAS